MGNPTVKLLEFRFHIIYIYICLYTTFFDFLLIETMVNQNSNEKEDLSVHSSLLNSSDIAPPTTNDSHILSFGMSPGKWMIINVAI